MIGILAGMGPKSTAPFVEKVVKLCQQRYGAKYDMDFPPVMIYSCPTPFYLDRPIDHSAMRDAIAAGAARLACCGVDYIAIPCNVAHIYYEFIQEAVSVPVLNMVDETIRSIPDTEKKITILATASTMEAEIYQRGLLQMGKEVVFEPRWQEEINHIIQLIKGGNALDEAKDLWAGLTKDIRQFATAGIVACTDLNVLTDNTSSQIILVDSSTCLATKVVDKYYLKI